jgi:serine/threonine protein kinase
MNHPNIVTIYDVGSADSVSYIAMELVACKTLRELLFGGAFPIKKSACLALPRLDFGIRDGDFGRFAARFLVRASGDVA